MSATKKKPRGKAFASGSDARRNMAGQRNAAAVATTAQVRALYVQVLHESPDAPQPREMNRLEAIVRQHVQSAAKLSKIPTNTQGIKALHD